MDKEWCCNIFLAIHDQCFTKPSTKIRNGSGENSRKNVSKSLKEVLSIICVLSGWLFMGTINFFMNKVDVK